MSAEQAGVRHFLTDLDLAPEELQQVLRLA
jgi:hypothetical protein